MKRPVKLNARKLRKKIYGQTSLKIKRHYIMSNGGIRNAPNTPRAVYQVAKRRGWDSAFAMLVAASGSSMPAGTGR